MYLTHKYQELKIIYHGIMLHKINKQRQKESQKCREE
jgi:hypothetical protein